MVPGELIHWTGAIRRGAGSEMLVIRMGKRQDHYHTVLELVSTGADTLSY